MLPVSVYTQQKGQGEESIKADLKKSIYAILRMKFNLKSEFIKCMANGILFDLNCIKCHPLQSCCKEVRTAWQNILVNTNKRY